MDHDRLFKELLTTFFVEFVELFLPDVARHMDGGVVEFLDKEIFTDIASSDSHEVDLIAKVRFRQGKRAFFLIHIENQAASKPDFPHRMFQYFSRLDGKFCLPVLPVAVFSFDRPLRPEPDRYIVDVADFCVVNFAFRAIQLNCLSWRDYLKKPNPVASALMTKMRIAPEDRPRVKLECLRMLATLKLDKARAELIGAFMMNYLKLTTAENAVYNKMLSAVEPKQRKVVMQLTNEWIEKGRQVGRKEGLEAGRKEGRLKGREEGRQEGREEARRETILLLLHERVGGMPPKLANQLNRLDDVGMTSLGKALFDFTNLADVERWLGQRRKPARIK